MKDEGRGMKQAAVVDRVVFEVTDVKQWHYCGRIVWYRFCWPDIRPVTALMEAGVRSHRVEVGREERRSLRTYGLTMGERAFDMPLQSAELGLRGRLDLAIAMPDRRSAGAEGVVVEYKDTETAAGQHHKVQLAAYALLLEETWKLPVPRGFVYHLPTRKVEEIRFTETLRRKVGVTVEAMREAVVGETMPPPPSSRRMCVSCEFRRFCNDVV